MIIGQKNFWTNMDMLIPNNRFPRFAILTGPKGSGKKTMAHHIASKLGGQKYVLPDIKVDTVRDMINMSYKQKERTVIIIPDADGMSVAAKNAILKVTEEPPNNTYFIMTLEGLHNTLDTIKSRATVYTLDNYSRKELELYLSTINGIKDDDKELLLSIATNPGQINLLHEQGVRPFCEYVDKVIDNIAKVSGANAFKIADKVALKQDSDGYDLELFFQIFMRQCLDKQIENNTEKDWAAAIEVTYQSLLDLRIKGVNKQFLIDRWILGVRSVWM